MPWLSIIIAIISFLTAKKNGASDASAAAIGALAGGASYYVTHETEWGTANLGSFDGVVQPVGPSQTVTKTDANGVTTTVKVPVPGSPETNSGQSGLWSTLSSWGPTGTAGVIGAGAVATSSNLQKYIPIALAIGAFFLLSR